VVRDCSGIDRGAGPERTHTWSRPSEGNGDPPPAEERIWHYLRSHGLANSVFRSLADIMDACETAWNRFAGDPGLVRSLCAVAWAPG